MPAAVEVKGLSKRFGSERALHSLDLSFERGEISAILGPSGAGKTTLLRILNLLDAPTAGGLYFDGREVGEYSGKERLGLRRRMAMVFQGGAVFNASVFENVAYGLKVRGAGKEEVKEKVRRALGIVGLSGYEERDARTLSGGERQRVNFAMATVIEPEVLLFDEPTANLDLRNEKVIHEILSRINGLGITIIMATHKQHEAISLAGRVAVLRGGKLEQVGAPEEVFYRPKTRFVAEFVGTENLFEAEVAGVYEQGGMIKLSTGSFEVEVRHAPLEIGRKACLSVRPEEVWVMREDVPINPKHRNLLSGEIREVRIQGGAMCRLLVGLDAGETLSVDFMRPVLDKMGLRVGRRVTLSLPPSSCHVIL